MTSTYYSRRSCGCCRTNVLLFAEMRNETPLDGLRPWSTRYAISPRGSRKQGPDHEDGIRRLGALVCYRGVTVGRTGGRDTRRPEGRFCLRGAHQGRSATRWTRGRPDFDGRGGETPASGRSRSHEAAVV